MAEKKDKPLPNYVPYHPPMAAQKPRPVTSVQATTDEESMAMHSNVQMSMEEAENTKMWARAHSKKAAPRDTIDVGHIELDTLNL